METQLIFASIYTFQGSVRHSFGLLSPNYAGCILAILLSATLGMLLQFRRRRLAVAACVPILLFLCYSLVLTYSRGALIAAIMGAGVACLAARSRSSQTESFWRTSVIPFIAFLGLVVIIAASVGFHDRLSANFVRTDASVHNRLELWTVGLRAFSDAPLLGWGYGSSGRVYHEFYQGLADKNRYLSLVNSWLTLGVEFGSLALMAALTLGFYPLIRTLGASACDRGFCFYFRRIVAPACAAAMVANIFSTLGLGLMVQCVYIGLFLAIIFVIGIDLYKRNLRPIIGAAALALSMCLLLTIGGAYLTRVAGVSFEYIGRSTVRIKRQGGAVRIPTESVLLLIDPALLTESPMREARRVLKTSDLKGDCVVCWSNEEFRKFGLRSFNKSVVMGKWLGEFLRESPSRSRTIVLYKPSVSSDALMRGRDRPIISAIILSSLDFWGVNQQWLTFAESERIPITISRQDHENFPL